MSMLTRHKTRLLEGLGPMISRLKPDAVIEKALYNCIKRSYTLARFKFIGSELNDFR
jgi:hypothetical protein